MPRLADAGDKQGRQQQRSSGTAWAQQAMLALTGGNPVLSVTESGSVTRNVGGDPQQGNITLESSGVMTTQLTISIGSGNLSETRSWDGSRPSGQWTGLDGQQHQMAQVNIWTDAVWFFPALSLLSDYSDPTLVFTDLGQVQYNGGSAEHIQIYRYLSALPQGPQQDVQRFSTVDYYLDSNTALPIAIAFSKYGDHNPNMGISVAAVYTQYQSVGGIQVPFQITELSNGSPYLQINITSASPNGQNLPVQKH
jgi:hypothetical protein